MRVYRAAKKQQYAELYADGEFGDKLRRFVATLNHFGSSDGLRLVNYVVDECGKWIWVAPEKFRHAALEAIDARIMKVRERAGLPVLDDPLPGQPDDVFRRCKREIEH